jgi:uncharacterized protein (DUF983 family)
MFPFPFFSNMLLAINGDFGTKFIPLPVCVLFGFAFMVPTWVLSLCILFPSLLVFCLMELIKVSSTIFFHTYILKIDNSLILN